MSFLFGGGQSPSTKAPSYTGVQVQTSVNTLPIPIIGGTVKLAPNIIGTDDFEKHKKSAGGKGGLTGKGGQDDYTATLLLALCEGVVDAVPAVLINTNKYQTLSKLGMTLFTGTWPGQAPWDYLVHKHPADALNYPGVAYLAVENYDLGSSASAPNHNPIVVRASMYPAPWCQPNNIAATYPALRSAFPSGFATADMALFIQDFLTSEQYGVPGFTSAAIDTSTLLSGPNATTTGDGAAQTYWRALGIGLCPQLTSQETASSALTRWLQLLNTAVVLSGKLLKFIPYGDQAVTANGVTYLPNLWPAYTLSDDDFVGGASEDPLLPSRIDPLDAKNVVRIEITADDGSFAYLPVEAWDQTAIENSATRRVNSDVVAHEVLGNEVGALIAQLILQRGLYVKNSPISLKLSSEFLLIEPMDIVPVTDAYLGYFDTPMRVLSVDEADNGEFDIQLEELRAGVATAVAYLKQGSSSAVPDAGQTAGNVNTPVIFEPSNTLVDRAEVWVAVSGAGGVFDPNWGGCEIWVSVDNDTYVRVSDVHAVNTAQAARMGTLTATLASYGGTNPDTGDTLYVDLSESEGDLISGTADDAANGRTLCYVDGELLSYTTATLSAATASGEAQTIPSVGPYTVEATHGDTFTADTSVAFALGGALTKVGSNPAAGQYSVDASGLYTFNAADAGKGVLLTYAYGNQSHYALTGLYRGQYGTTAGAHSSGTQFARLDDAIFRFRLDPAYVGKLIYIKLVSFNLFGDGNGLQDISTLTAYTYEPSGAGLPSGVIGSGSYIVQAADVSATFATVTANILTSAFVSVVIRRGTTVVTRDAVITVTPGAPGSIKVQSGATFYTLTAGDYVTWAIIRAGGGIPTGAMRDETGRPVLDETGDWIPT